MTQRGRAGVIQARPRSRHAERRKTCPAADRA